MTVERAQDTAIERALGMAAAAAEVRVLERVGRYVEQETPSGSADAVNALSLVIESELAAAGAHVESFDVPGFGRNLRARFAGREQGVDPVVVLGHIDTVHPIGTLETQPFARLDGRVSGPGIYDMKTGVALFVEALGLLHARGTGPRRPVTFLVTCDEEVGSHSARPLIADSARNAFAALVPEPSMPDGSVKTARKGVATYRFEITGRAAHAGIEPERAISAVTELSHQLPRILALADHARGTTVSVGLLHAGTASNTIAARAWGSIDVRSVAPEEAERVDRGLMALRPDLAGASLSIRCTESRPPLVRTEQVVRLYEHARDLAAVLGVTLGEGATGGGSDGSLIATYGVPTLDGLGPRGGGAHSTEEHVIAEDLPFRLALVTRLLETL
ncbi:MAG: M20 family metallopeptidase [Longimicrobiales bacterium]